MKDSLFCALMFAAIVSIGDVAFCDDQPGTQQAAETAAIRS
jgi:hypothetical protein